MIELNSVDQHYGGTQILWNLDLSIKKGSCVSVIGRNGVGKTTLLKCLMGLLPISSGQIILGDQDFTNKSVSDRAQNGIAYVPQGRDIFPMLTVSENLRVGLAARSDSIKKIPRKIFELFPVLDEMLERRGGDLSGGQQQQLAIGRALVSDPNLLILDEPSEGIQPNIVTQIGEVISTLNNRDGVTVLLVEQKLAFAKTVGQEFRLMEKGSFVASGQMSDLSDDLILKHLAV
tara:strand:- start:122 stop:817 length:696 start_codon:yes stop_codon:yes gene_type:complete